MTDNNDIEEKIARLKKLTGTEDDKNVVDGPSIITFGEAFNNPEYLKEPQWVSPWLCQEGRTTLFIGEPSAAKSWISTYDAAQASDQNDKRILYINIDEPPSDLIRRFKKFNQQDKLKTQVAILNPATMNLDWEILFEAIESHKPDIIYFDSWDKLVGMLNNGKIPHSHENTKWREIIDQFTLMATKYNVALCILIHTTKSDKKQFSGNQQILAAVDISVVVSKTGPLVRTLEYGKRVVRDPVQLEWQKDADGGQKELFTGKLDCKDWMLKFMDDGLDHKTPSLITAGRVFHHTKNSIEDAKKALEIDGFIERSTVNKHVTYKITTEGRTELGNVEATNLLKSLKNVAVNHLP